MGGSPECSSLVALRSAPRLRASNGAESDASLIIIDALQVDDVGQHRSNISRRASCHHQLLRVAVNAVASAELVAFVGDDAAVAAAAIATATTQVEPSMSSSLPILRSSAVGVPMVPSLQQVPPSVGRTFDVVGGVSHRRSCTWPSSLFVRRSSFSNLRHLADSSPPDLCYSCLTGSLAPCSWRRHRACGGTVCLKVHSGVRPPYCCVVVWVARALACIRM